MQTSIHVYFESGHAYFGSEFIENGTFNLLNLDQTPQKPETSQGHSL